MNHNLPSVGPPPPLCVDSPSPRVCSVADTDLYAMLFTPIRQQVLNVTEIGVAAGQSLQMWHDFFPRAQLWGLDLKSGACFERCPSKFAGHPRVHLRWGNSCKKPHVDRLGFARESMDLVLDDGDHFPLSNEITLVHFWPFVKKGGYYVIEDVATGARQATGRYGCRAALRGFPERCGFAPGGFAQLVHNRTSLGAEARAIMEEADTVLVDTLPGHRNLDAFRERMGVTWMRDQVDHNSHLVVLRKRTEARRHPNRDRDRDPDPDPDPNPNPNPEPDPDLNLNIYPDPDPNPNPNPNPACNSHLRTATPNSITLALILTLCLMLGPNPDAKHKPSP